MSNNNELDEFFLYMARSVGLIDECQRNKLIFEHNVLRNKESLVFYVAVTRDANDCVHYQNLASVTAWHDKRYFLTLIAQHLPYLLWQRVLRCDDSSVEVMTPLDTAAYLQNTLLVSHILELPEMLHYAETEPAAYVSLIDRSLTYAGEEREIITLLEEKKSLIRVM